MLTLMALGEYLGRILPGFVLITASFFFFKPGKNLRIVFYVFSFLLLRDAMTPLGFWRVGSEGLVFWMRFNDSAPILIILGLICLCLCLLLLRFDKENRSLFRLQKSSAYAGIGVGISGAILVVLPIWLLFYRSMPLDARGGLVAGHLLIPLLVCTLFGNFLEELLFRGYIQGKLEETMAPWKAGLLSGLAFSTCHVILAAAVTDAGAPLLAYALWEGMVAGLVASKYGVIPATLTHGGAIFLISSSLL